MPDLEALLSRLASHRVEFGIVGGFAAVAHGASLMTQDVGVCCAFTCANLLRLQEALADLNPVHRMTPGRVPLRLTPTNCESWNKLYLATDWGHLDCLREIAGVGDCTAAKRSRVQVSLGSETCDVLGIDALIKAKEAMSRPRDREAVLPLKAIRERQG